MVVCDSVFVLQGMISCVHNTTTIPLSFAGGEGKKKNYHLLVGKEKKKLLFAGGEGEKKNLSFAGGEGKKKTII